MERSSTTSAAETFGDVAEDAGEGTRGIPRRPAAAAVVGLVVLLGAFCWLVTVAPAVVSLALAVGAAVAWSVWLDRKEHP